MDTFHFLFLLIQGAVLAVLLVVAVVRARRGGMDALLGKVPAGVLEGARALGGVGELEPRGAGIAFRIEGRDLRLTGADHHQGGPQTLYLGTTVARPEGPRSTATDPFRGKPGTAPSMPWLAHMVLRRESSRDQLGKRLGLNAEPQTGDAAFDDAIYVEHDGDRVGTRLLLGIPELRGQALRIVDDRRAIVLNTEGHAVAIRWAVGLAPRGATEMREAALSLSAFAETIPPVRSLDLRSPTRVNGKALATGGLIFLIYGATMATLLQFSRGSPVDTGFYLLCALVSVGIGLIAIAGGWRFARGRSRGLAMLGWIAAASVAAAPPVTTTALILLNQAGVRADRTEEVGLVRLYSQSSKGRRSCYAEIVPWRARLTLLRDPSISCNLVHAGKRPKTATLTVGRGRLGYEWIADVAVERP